MLRKIAERLEPQEATTSFVLRLPNKDDLILKGLVEKGVAKSENELIVGIIETFLLDLEKAAQKNAEKKENE
jgi:hypothetical protein